MKKWILRIVSGAATLGTVVALAVLPGAGTASADPNCSDVFGCSRVENWSGLTAYARHDWTCDSGSTGTAVASGCEGGGTWLLGTDLATHTPNGEDWDVLRIDAGWCYQVQFVN